MAVWWKRGRMMSQVPPSEHAGNADAEALCAPVDQRLPPTLCVPQLTRGAQVTGTADACTVSGARSVAAVVAWASLAGVLLGAAVAAKFGAAIPTALW